MIKLIPMGDRVIVRRQEAQARTPGGLYIPDANKETPSRGEVLEVGPKVGKEGLSSGVAVAAPERPLIAPGDVVVFGKYAGTEVEENGEKLLVLREEDIIARIGA